MFPNSDGVSMKATFPGFYSITDSSLKDIWLSDSTLFVFDTNCLLNLYRCEDHTREDIIDVMKEIKPRIWIPFQVGYEYQRNRRKVIEESVASLNKIQCELQNIYTQNILSSGSVKPHLYNSLNEEISQLQETLKTHVEKYVNDKIAPRIASKKSIAEHDTIRDSIDSIILDNIGPIPSQDKINKIDDEGINRYKNKQPPGFKDDAKKSTSFYSNIVLQDKYGDLYLWKQIIEKAKSDNIKNVIFICDDNKSDWWFSYGGKTHGVLEALKTEICQEASLENFKLINQLTFLHEAKSYLVNINISDSSLKEVEELTSISLTNSKNEKSLKHQALYRYYSHINRAEKEELLNNPHEFSDNFEDDVNKFIEVCQEVDGTLKDAEKLFSEAKKFKLQLSMNKIRLNTVEMIEANENEILKLDSLILHCKSVVYKLKETFTFVTYEKKSLMAEMEFLNEKSIAVLLSLRNELNKLRNIHDNS